MKKIKLTQGKVAIVDDADFDAVNEFKWYFGWKDKAHIKGYATRTINDINGKKSGDSKEYLHNFLMGPTSSKIHVDHINGNTLDNQRNNLRVVSININLLNAGLRKDNKTGFKGVFRRKSDQKYTAQIKVYGKLHYLGSFVLKSDAVQARQEAEKKYVKF